ncbi:hypothetical protein FGO68_gene17470 [Halteria grandinella]|uniref:Uncharacterized protein n=1 Tax=Halteria grandinella TaxID=5974 RepID=A0A8J8N990_HALGN|nr:hypothetical protein FGO68_gene17470 [Halteria grandinella]
MKLYWQLLAIKKQYRLSQQLRKYQPKNQQCYVSFQFLKHILVVLTILALSYCQKSSLCSSSTPRRLFYQCSQLQSRSLRVYTQKLNL